MDNTENYPLDEAAIEFLAERDAEIARVSAPYLAQQTGMLLYFVRLHKLSGPWRVAENRRELVKATESIPAARE